MQSNTGLFQNKHQLDMDEKYKVYTNISNTILSQKWHVNSFISMRKLYEIVLKILNEVWTNINKEMVHQMALTARKCLSAKRVA